MSAKKDNYTEPDMGVSSPTYLDASLTTELPEYPKHAVYPSDVTVTVDRDEKLSAIHGIDHIDVVIEHESTGRRLVHEFHRDDNLERLVEREVGYVGGREVFTEPRQIAEYHDDGVFVKPLGESMEFELYAMTVGADDFAYRIGSEFERRCDDAGELSYAG